MFTTEQLNSHCQSWKSPTSNYYERTNCWKLIKVCFYESYHLWNKATISVKRPIHISNCLTFLNESYISTKVINIKFHKFKSIQKLLTLFQKRQLIEICSPCCYLSRKYDCVSPKVKRTINATVSSIWNSETAVLIRLFDVAICQL